VRHAGIKPLDPLAERGTLLDRECCGGILEAEQVDRRAGDDVIDLAALAECGGA
jgi:hypothetical protein